MEKTFKPCVAELIGTFALVFLAGGAACAGRVPGNQVPVQSYVVAVALAAGFAYAAAVSATVNVSGGFLNPAITLTLWVFRRLDGARAAWLIGAQLVGALLAGGALRLTFGGDAFNPATPHLNLDAFKASGEGSLPLAVLLSGAGIELALTFLLTFAIFGTMLDPRAPRLSGLGAGLALAADVFVGFALTGAAVNPARWLGPAAWELASTTGAMRDHAVYWIGPTLGALLAGAAYTALVLPDERKPGPGA
ncbi:MAG TPA: aquaporin [Gemmataceae bacterium]|nr:aquaporin [Gemmataceae bacterium]